MKVDSANLQVEVAQLDACDVATPAEVVARKKLVRRTEPEYSQDLRLAMQLAFATLWLAVGLGELYVVRKTDLLSS